MQFLNNLVLMLNSDDGYYAKLLTVRLTIMRLNKYLMN